MFSFLVFCFTSYCVYGQSQENFDQKLEEFSETLSTAMLAQALAAIANSDPSIYDGVKDVTVQVVQDPCIRSPRVVSSRPAQITIPRHYLVAKTVFFQPAFFFLMEKMSEDEFVAMVDVVRLTTVPEFQKEVNSACIEQLRTGEYGDVQIQAAPIAAGMSEEVYIEVLRTLDENPTAEDIGNLFNNVFYFVLLHEIGHILIEEGLISGRLDPTFENEVDADRFATEMLNGSGISIATYGATLEFLIALSENSTCDLSRRLEVIYDTAMLPSEYIISGYRGINGALGNRLLPRLSRIATIMGGHQSKPSC
ncbi:MAG: hypothetical protein AAFY65_13275 [Pseudomonadota bacterium]